MSEHREYFEFYLQGRDDGSDDEEISDVDVVSLGKRVVEGADLRSTAMDAAKGVAGALLASGMKAWSESSRRVRQDVKAAGGDLSRAFKNYSNGVTDSLATTIEDEILVAISEGDEYDPGEEDDDADDADDKKDVGDDD